MVPLRTARTGKLRPVVLYHKFQGIQPLLQDFFPPLQKPRTYPRETSTQPPLPRGRLSCGIPRISEKSLAILKKLFDNGDMIPYNTIRVIAR